MGGLSRKTMPENTDDEIVRALARSSSPFTRHVQHFRHAGKSYIAYEGGVLGFKPGTLVATGYAVSVVADGHHPTPDQLAAGLDAIEAKRSSERARGGA
jgi:hypothetical protein